MAAALVLLGAGIGTNDAAHAQARVVAFGDSYVHPSAAGWREGQRPWLASLGEPVRNFGHAGDGVASTLKRVRRTAGTTFEVVVLEVGINDVRRSGTDPARLARFRADYEQVLQRLSSALRVVVVPPLPVRGWGKRGSEAALKEHRDVVLELAALHANVRIAEPLWQPDTMLLPDGLHPDATGRAAIAAAVHAALNVS
ncbi:MAG: SGNH/GDSL hydrolase family protein [Actinomycetota bacterium]|nr:SGNH/GDSL hydrolase family protein [Actinomycetota bacterium]